MTVYIVEHRKYRNILQLCRQSDLVESHISQEGYKTIEDAQRFIESRLGSFVKESEMRYYNSIGKEEYLIHDIVIK